MVLLNTLVATYGRPDRIEDDSFSLPEKNDLRPFPEDFAMRRLLWAEDIFPVEWFTTKKVDEEEKYQERPSMTSQRKERLLWLAVKISRQTPCLVYDGSRFSVGSQTLASIQPRPPRRLGFILIFTSPMIPAYINY